MTLAFTRPTRFAVLFWILITRYWRPWTVCSFFEKLISGEIDPPAELGK